MQERVDELVMAFMNGDYGDAITILTRCKPMEAAALAVMAYQWIDKHTHDGEMFIGFLKGN
jgi:hypothetical protein